MGVGESVVAIRTRGLTRRFGDVLAVAPLDLDISDGVTGLLGPNGSGKSTLLRMLVGLVRPDAGCAEVAGVALSGDGTAIRRRCTYAPGELSLYAEMRGREFLDWILRGRERGARRRARELADQLELPLGGLVRSYSHGMKRQLLFVGAMAPEVPVRILDEPTEGLDPHKRAEILSLVRDDAASGTAVLFSSHHLGEVEFLGDRLLFLDRGKLLADESPDRLRSEARRAMRMSFAPGTDGAALDRALEALAGTDQATDLGRDGLDVRARLATEDPVPFLRAWSETHGAPQPSEIDYGRLSLRDLYRDLYGVEGL